VAQPLVPKDLFEVDGVKSSFETAVTPTRKSPTGYYLAFTTKDIFRTTTELTDFEQRCFNGSVGADQICANPAKQSALDIEVSKMESNHRGRRCW